MDKKKICQDIQDIKKMHTTPSLHLKEYVCRSSKQKTSESELRLQDSGRRIGEKTRVLWFAIGIVDMVKI